MAISTGDCQDNKCKLLAECNRVYKGSHPPCSDIAEALKPSHNKQSTPCSHCTKFPAGETTLGWKWCPWCGRKL